MLWSLPWSRDYNYNILIFFHDGICDSLRHHTIKHPLNAYDVSESRSRSRYQGYVYRYIIAVSTVKRLNHTVASASPASHVFSIIILLVMIAECCLKDRVLPTYIIYVAPTRFLSTCSGKG